MFCNASAQFETDICPYIFLGSVIGKRIRARLKRDMCAIGNRQVAAIIIIYINRKLIIVVIAAVVAGTENLRLACACNLLLCIVAVADSAAQEKRPEQQSPTNPRKKNSLSTT